ncbi:hypothetical protein [Chitinophaga pinensis]|uniref:Uncharacterized protein n=1 Tax=Chitinophaga pinensis (strain ATCC 43595 / DSM 2588 / LMG 13176 / NBRC 15968 / NCIMB 11800 / UQM 2034) TaxID=485918 RepID=A0A979GR15_CHIPD|nr:hypothetical protein [Chitinophaga pinensis]ACU60588.1 hypothetical protein Cpin_3120 [Chitinophaga pinensis DSM 2588]
MPSGIKYLTFDNCDFSGVIFCDNDLFYSKMNIRPASAPVISDDEEQNVVCEITKIKPSKAVQP